jgi:hypothetical protein
MINLFSNTGGVASACFRAGIPCVLYTASSVYTRKLLTDKIALGQLSDGHIHDFVYNIPPPMPDFRIHHPPVREEGGGGGMITALIQDYRFQNKEIANYRGSGGGGEGGFATADSSPPSVEELRFISHNTSIRNIHMVARAFKVSKLLLFFTYDPLLGEKDPSKFSSLTGRGYRISVYEFASHGLLNVSPFVYCLLAIRMTEEERKQVKSTTDGGVGGNNVKMEISRDALLVQPLYHPSSFRMSQESPSRKGGRSPSSSAATTLTSTTTTLLEQQQAPPGHQKDQLMSRMVLWDIAPCIVEQMIMKVLSNNDDDRDEGERRGVVFKYIRTTVPPTVNPSWDFNKIPQSDIYSLENQPVSDARLASELLGWPDDFIPISESSSSSFTGGGGGGAGLSNSSAQ